MARKKRIRLRVIRIRRRGKSKKIKFLLPGKLTLGESLRKRKELTLKRIEERKTR